MRSHPTVVHYTGHRMAGLGVAAEARVAASIGVCLDRLVLGAAFGSLASGADILFAEAFLARGTPVHVWLPFEVARFKLLSVQPAGPHWIARFERAFSAASSVEILRSGSTAEASFAACSAASMSAALAAADAGRQEALQIAVWNGEAASGAAGTGADVAAWHARGRTTWVVDPRPGAAPP